MDGHPLHSEQFTGSGFVFKDMRMKYTAFRVSLSLEVFPFSQTDWAGNTVKGRGLRVRKPSLCTGYV